MKRTTSTSDDAPHHKQSPPTPVGVRAARIALVGVLLTAIAILLAPSLAEVVESWLASTAASAVPTTTTDLADAPSTPDSLTCETVRTYFNLLRDEECLQAWSHLTSRYVSEENPSGAEDYCAYWRANPPELVDVVTESETSAKAVCLVWLRYPTGEEDYYKITLIRDTNRGWMLDWEEAFTIPPDVFTVP